MSYPSSGRGRTPGRRHARTRTPVLVLVSLIIAVSLTITVASSFAGEQTRTCTVTGTDRARNSDGGSDMRVYTEQCGTLQVRDLWLRGQFSSADIFGQLEEGKTYEVTTVGWRVPIFSSFTTILGDPVEAAR
ncbi:hypothetical protein [Cellulosimicrobium sp. Marseille-Q4280]|uniref:hypothetical protein n=1 Tax=Cellulosimicrobium sp. Marseille-Q4280 TaxID=2937992 RepID=UPI00203BEA06|nr:hypothetical protein [Cellulosimicrobium sp. Marseille-Q4280]